MALISLFLGTALLKTTSGAKDICPCLLLLEYLTLPPPAKIDMCTVRYYTRERERAGKTGLQSNTNTHTHTHAMMYHELFLENEPGSQAAKQPRQSGSQASRHNCSWMQLCMSHAIHGKQRSCHATPMGRGDVTWQSMAVRMCRRNSTELAKYGCMHVPHILPKRYHLHLDLFGILFLCLNPCVQMRFCSTVLYLWLRTSASCVTTPCTRSMRSPDISGRIPRNQCGQTDPDLKALRGITELASNLRLVLKFWTLSCWNRQCRSSGCCHQYGSMAMAVYGMGQKVINET